MHGRYARALLFPGLALLAACGQHAPVTPSVGTGAGPRPWAVYLPQHAGPLAPQGAELGALAERADWLANQPELQDPEATQALYAHWQEPSFLAEGEASYYEPESPVQPPNGDPSALLSAQALSNRLSPQKCVVGDDACVPHDPPVRPPPQNPASTLDDIKGVAFGTVDNHNAQYDNRLVINTQYPVGIVWDRDGCSVGAWAALTTPTWFLWTYKDRFGPACNVHDFGYRNLAIYEKNEANRKRADDNFLGNMRDICHHRPWYQRPACRAAAWSYHLAVRKVGANFW